VVVLVLNKQSLKKRESNVKPPRTPQSYRFKQSSIFSKV
jgi:hypothetical protein